MNETLVPYIRLVSVPRVDLLGVCGLHNLTPTSRIFMIVLCWVRDLYDDHVRRLHSAMFHLLGHAVVNTRLSTWPPAITIFYYMINSDFMLHCLFRGVVKDGRPTVGIHSGGSGRHIMSRVKDMDDLCMYLIRRSPSSNPLSAFRSVAISLHAVPVYPAEDPYMSTSLQWRQFKRVEV